MALAAVMTRKKRERMRELEKQQEGAEALSKEERAVSARKAANEALKKIILGQEIQKQHRERVQKQKLLSQSQSSVAIISRSQISYGDKDEAPFESSGDAYTVIYIGLTLICLGVIVIFVGLGEKGFKTMELKMLGPIICLIGLTCIVVKVVHCAFPNMFKIPNCSKKKAKLSDKSNLMEKGFQNGHFDKKGASSRSRSNVSSPVVKLKSSKKSQRPRSAFPNYISSPEETSSDDEPIEPGKTKPRPNRVSNAFQQSPKRKLVAQPSVVDSVLVAATPVTPVFDPSPQYPRHQQQIVQQRSLTQKSQSQQAADEVVLSPHGLVL